MRRSIPVVLAIALLALTLGPVAPALAASLSSLTALSTSVTGGKPASVTIKLAAAAPSGGQIITLTSSDTNLATVPSSVTIAAGRTSAAVTVTTKPVVETAKVTVSANDGSTTKSLTLTVKPATLQSLTVPTTAVGGVSKTGSAILTGPAPTGGIVVGLAASGAGVSVPSSVTVAAGKSSATFAITLPIVTENLAATITATYGGVTKTSNITVTPAAISSVSFSPTLIGDGITTKGTVRLSGPAPGVGATVALTVPDGAPVTLPATVKVTAGQTSATFTATGSSITASTAVTVTASYNGTKTAKLTVAPPSLFGITFSPISIAAGGTTTGTVTLTSAAPVGGATVSLSVSPSALSVPASVTVPAGQKTATFTATGGSPAVQTSVKVTGSFGGTSKYTMVTVKAAAGAGPALGGLVVVPATVGSQSPVGIGVVLTKPATAAGFAVTLTSSDQAVLPLNRTVTITSGYDAFTIFPTTGTVTTSKQVTITASGGGQSYSVAITVVPYAPLQVTTATSVVGGKTISGTVVLTGPAPTGGATVSLRSSNAAAVVPASVTIPAGSTSATFSITTSAVSSTQTATITASANGGTVTTAISVLPLQVSGWGTFPTAMVTGNSASAVVSINGTPPAGGATVTLTSSNPSVLSVPSSVTITSGTSAIFTITAGPVSAATNVTVTASLGGKTISKVVTVSPPSLTGVLLSGSSMLLNSTYSGRADLNGPAPAGGITVQLTSSSPDAASVPSSVTVPEGATNAAFAITTGNVTAPVTVTFTATANGVTKTSSTQVIPIGPWQGQLSTAATPCLNNNRTYKFTLSGPAPAGGLTVAITTSNGIHAPESVQVAEGATSFNVAACGDVVNYNTAGSLTATANGLSARYVLGLPIASEGLTVSASTVTGGTSMTLTYSISDAASAAGLTATITSSNPAVVPNLTVTVPEGETSTQVTITPAEVTANATVKLTTNGYWPASVTFTVTAPTVSSAAIDEEAAPAATPTSTPTPEVTPEPTQVPAEPSPTEEVTAPVESTEVAPEPTQAPAVEPGATPAA